MSASFWSNKSLISRGRPAVKLCAAWVSQRVFGQTVGVSAQLGQLQTEVSSLENCPCLWCRPEAAGRHGDQRKPPFMPISVGSPEAQSSLHSFPLEAAVLGHFGFWLLKRTGCVVNGCHKVRFSCVCICMCVCTCVRMSKWWRWVFTCAYMWRPEVNVKCLPQSFLHLTFWGRIPYWTWGSSIKLDYMASKLQGASVSTFPRDAMTGTQCSFVPGFFCGCWESEFMSPCLQRKHLTDCAVSPSPM